MVDIVIVSNVHIPGIILNLLEGNIGDGKPI